MGKIRLQLNPSMIENGCGFFGFPSSGNFPSLFLDGVVLPQTEMMNNLAILLDAQLLVEKQATVMSKRIFRDP